MYINQNNEIHSLLFDELDLCSEENYNYEFRKYITGERDEEIYNVMKSICIIVFERISTFQTNS